MNLEFIRSVTAHTRSEGAIPKDGPSAGITLATAMASALARSRSEQCGHRGEITFVAKSFRSWVKDNFLRASVLA